MKLISITDTSGNLWEINSDSILCIRHYPKKDDKTRIHIYLGPEYGFEVDEANYKKVKGS